ncbi:glutamate racemase [Nitrosopumilus sp.]|uniref:glutamate racemase n=1 Tax=Nitrosopumilus sp. TaxID=2024843 RepID=UPI002610C8FB|nr:aspartate/glutamate racemase family protein [Nitrosopumilus sp.]
MARIVVFDSGLGSLSIITPIRKLCKVDIIYYADSKNFPYGEKTQTQLNTAINTTLNRLEENFCPDLIVIASNTPSLVLNISKPNMVTVKPPLLEAKKISKTKNIGILATKSTIVSKGLSNYIHKNNLPNSYRIHKINGSNLVNLVENGKFLTNYDHCRKIIKKELTEIITKKNIDTITLSSTHLPFLKKLLQKEFPNVKFIEPGNQVAEQVFKKIKNKQSKRNSLKIFTSGNPTVFHKKLLKLKIQSKVRSF